jgi:hypothetical protein
MATNKSTERDATSLPELFQLNGKYHIGPTDSTDDLLNDVGCLLEAVEGVLQEIVERDEQNSAAVWAAMYLVRQATGINNELCQRDLSARRAFHG